MHKIMDQIIFLLDGQGSQYFQMARELYTNHAFFRNELERMDQMLAEEFGISPLRYIYSPDRKKGRFCSKLSATHPAIFMVEYALGKLLMDSGVAPKLMVGYSLGEFAAAALSGAMDARDALACVMVQAQLIEKEAPESRMLAVLASSDVFYSHPELHTQSELCAVNSPKHFIVGGTEENIRKIRGALRGQRIISQELPIPRAFHTSLIDGARSGFVGYAGSRCFKKPSTPIYSCASGCMMEEITGSHLWDAVRMPVFFPNTAGNLEKAGAKIYIDIGPGGTMANFLKHNCRKEVGNTYHAVITPLGNEMQKISRIQSLYGIR